MLNWLKSWKKPPQPEEIHVGIVSGYFNPLTCGHLEYLKTAYNECDNLVVIINNDKQVEMKGSCPFMDEKSRYEIVAHLECVDTAFLAVDPAPDVSLSIFEIVRNWRKQAETSNFTPRFTFFNSGDRDQTTWNQAEKEICERCDVVMEYIQLPKIASSSELIKKAYEWKFKEKDQDHVQKVIELELLKGYIRVHRDKRGHDRCKENDVELYMLALPTEPLPESLGLPSEYEFMAGCKQYYLQQKTCEELCERQAALRKVEDKIFEDMSDMEDFCALDEILDATHKMCDRTDAKLP